MWTAGSSLCSTQTSLRGTLCWWLWRLVDEKRKVQLHLWLSLKFTKSLVLVFTTQGTERLIVLWVFASVFRDSTNEQVFLARRPLTDFYRMENVSPAERVCVCNNMEAQPCFSQMYSESVQQLLKRPTSDFFFGHFALSVLMIAQFGFMSLSSVWHRLIPATLHNKHTACVCGFLCFLNVLCK